VKEKLECIQVADEDQFLESLQEILRSIDQQELNGIFYIWIWPVQKVNQGKVMETMSENK
jgi:hypothetical protein